MQKRLFILVALTALVGCGTTNIANRMAEAQKTVVAEVTTEIKASTESAKNAAVKEAKKHVDGELQQLRAELAVERGKVQQALKAKPKQIVKRVVEKTTSLSPVLTEDFNPKPLWSEMSKLGQQIKQHKDTAEKALKAARLAQESISQAKEVIAATQEESSSAATTGAVGGATLSLLLAVLGWFLRNVFTKQKDV